jgi:hypothetical protein
LGSYCHRTCTKAWPSEPCTQAKLPKK